MKFEFATATRIIFGSGRIADAVTAAASIGSRALIIIGKTPARLDPFLAALSEKNIECTKFSILNEPTISDVAKGVGVAKEAQSEFVIGYGGGSILDGAKAISALMTNPGSPLDYLEVVGEGNPLKSPCAPCICIPTTAGTGCEVTRNSVLISPEHGVKVSLRSPLMLPLLAVVDSELTHTLPPSITASTGMDALTQLLEPFVCKFANPFTDSFCRDGIRRVAASLFQAFRDGNNAGARENMALASLFGGLALANSGLGAVHGLAAVVGGMLPIPHGMVCARLLPHVMEANLEALRRRSEDSLPLARYDEIAYLLTGRRSARAQDGIAWVQSMCRKLAIPNLSTYGMKEEDIPIIATQAQKASSMKGNPITLSWDELTEILAKAMVSKI